MQPAWNGSSEPAGVFDLTGDPNIDGILARRFWSDGSITYSFPDQASDYGAYSYVDGNGVTHFPTATFQQVLAAQQTAIHFAMSVENGPLASQGFSVEGFTNLDVGFNGTTTGNATMRFGRSDDAQPTAFAFYPSSSNVGGDVWLGTQVGGSNLSNPAAGNYAWATILHEIGHGLGLKHGHAGDSGFPNANPNVLPSNVDAMEYSIMTYRSFINGPTNGYTNETNGFAQTFMMLDIAALQAMYGADFSSQSNNTDTVYKWDPTSGDTLINGQVGIDAAANRIFATIWDGGGVDTYDLSSYTGNLMLDLRPGEESLFSTTQQAHLGSGNFASGNIYNALQFQGDARSLIENAIGGTGNDTITGNAANNSLFGGQGDDTLSGGNGNDLLAGGAGVDQINGEGGVDTADYSASAASVNVNLSTGTGSGGDAQGDTLTGIENLIGSNVAGTDVLTGDGTANHIQGLAGNDILVGLGGADILVGGTGVDTADYSASGGRINVNLTTGAGLGGDAHGDTLSGIENLIGTNIAMTDFLTGDAGANHIQGLAGDDLIAGLGGADVLIGGSGVDTADYSASASRIAVNLSTGYAAGGDAHGDTLSGIENLIGTNSSLTDFLTGDAGANHIQGLAGDDLIAGLGGADVLIGGSGVDTADYSASASRIAVNLSTGYAAGGDAHGDTLSGIENLIGTNVALTDFLTGNSLANRIEGGAGDDLIAGLGGADVLIGGSGVDTADYSASGGRIAVNLSTGYAAGGDAHGDTLSGIENLIGTNVALTDFLTGDAGANRIEGLAGDDEINGKEGADIFVGGGGDDLFIFDTALGAGNIDAILDFVVADDMVRLASSIFTGLSVGTLTAAAFRVGAAAADADDRIIYNAGSGGLFFDVDGNGAQGQVQFASLSTGLALTNDNFLVA
ncbi:hypothetical protein FQ775_23720 [Nitratireductor mangrovi]|uniref:Peptidase metallopeptidase domain-containing protein n=1 Tax=Nitratireductor mangrovi TaxID=2599600 RepID=A0A6H0DZQ9_9HYPH|nr:M10 family metallopeptidase [Nitratireductor mangrovi]QIS94617.1 hypothetical protein FQ775_23720 [Nitratireductor mangrovi]